MFAANWLLIRAYLFRGAVLWLLARSLISAAIVLAHLDPFALSTRSSAIIVLVATAIGIAQTIRLRESVLLGNLGVSRAMLAAYLALLALAGELAIAMIGAASA